MIGLISVKALSKSRVSVSAHARRVAKAVQARDGLRSEADAIERIIEEYEEKILDPELRPPFVEDPARFRKGGHRRARSVFETFG